MTFGSLGNFNFLAVDVDTHNRHLSLLNTSDVACVVKESKLLNFEISTSFWKG